MKDFDVVGWVLLILFFTAFGFYNFNEYTFLKDMRDELVEIKYILQAQQNS